MRSVGGVGRRLARFSRGGDCLRMPRIMDSMSLLAGNPLPSLPLNNSSLAVKAPLGGSKNLSPLVIMEVGEYAWEQQEQSDFLHHGGGETRLMQAVRLPCQAEN